MIEVGRRDARFCWGWLMDKLIVFSEEELIVIRNKGINHVYAHNGSSQFKRALLLLYFWR